MGVFSRYGYTEIRTFRDPCHWVLFQALEHGWSAEDSSPNIFLKPEDLLTFHRWLYISWDSIVMHHGLPPQRKPLLKIFIHHISFSLGTQCTKQLMQFGAEVVLEKLTIPWVTGWVSFYQYVVCCCGNIIQLLSTIDKKWKTNKWKTGPACTYGPSPGPLHPAAPILWWVTLPAKKIILCVLELSLCMLGWIWNGICLYQVGVATSSCPLTEPGYRRWDIYFTAEDAQIMNDT